MEDLASYCIIVHLVLSYVEGKVSLGESAETTWTTLDIRATINEVLQTMRCESGHCLL